MSQEQEQELTGERVADILAASREYLEEHGRIVNALVDDRGRVCAAGAIVLSQDLPLRDIYVPEVVEPCRMLAESLALPVESHHLRATESVAQVCRVTHWNDRVDVQEVLDGFAKAEKVARLGYDPDLGYSG
jgi:hypothetical protein